MMIYNCHDVENDDDGDQLMIMMMRIMCNNESHDDNDGVQLMIMKMKNMFSDESHDDDDEMTNLHVHQPVLKFVQLTAGFAQIHDECF